MVNIIMPIDYQFNTNIAEHNQLVNKVNEIVQAINDMDIENIPTLQADVATLKTQVATLISEMSNAETNIDTLIETVGHINDSISTINAKISTYGTDIANLKTETAGLAKSLVSNIILTSATGEGKLKVGVETEDGTIIYSNDYDTEIATSIELMQGSSAGMVKAQFTKSNGEIIQSNDFIFESQAVGTDKYISAFVFKNGTGDGTISASITLSDGTTIEANNFVLPISNTISTAITTLNNRVTAVEQKNTSQDTEINALDARVTAIEDVGQIEKFENGKLGTVMGSTVEGNIGANTDGTGSVNGFSTLKGRVDTHDTRLQTLDEDIVTFALAKTGSNNVHLVTPSGNGTEQPIVDSVGINVSVDNKLQVSVNNVASPQVQLPSGGGDWEEIDINALPKDFSRTDILRFEFKIKAESQSPFRGDDTRSSFATFRLSGATGNPMNVNIPILMDGYAGAFNIWSIDTIGNFSSLNKGSFAMSLYYIRWDGNGWSDGTYNINKSNFNNYIRHFWRKK